jgi:hypothetical protein
VIAITIEPEADAGFAVKRNGILLIRTASETEWQAKGNGLVLVFGADPAQIDWAHPEDVRAAWAKCVEREGEDIEIVPCRVHQTGGAV